MNAIDRNGANDILKNGFIQLGIYYAQQFEKDKVQFKKDFLRHSSIRSVCKCIYWAYLVNGLIEEVLPEKGESEERFIGRKILQVINVIKNDHS